MSFAEILKKWETQERNGKGARRMAEWLERYPPEKVEPPASPDPDPIERSRRLRQMHPQEALDLHGLAVREAVQATERFLGACASRGLEKVLIIHGKGNHSRGEPVLGRAIRQCLERHPLAGAFGKADRMSGGRGALWVFLRQRSR